ncbi:uncharacterized protein LOC110465875 [Mizuhopecten yessoensis]|uniref:Uncharacterized protein n=1 Tax=Mizuhopecten yessoensis TaxID=6573 RepID=A0A210PQR9_MIZYE|nr:uncharacterized protein LOC110465875 [Mizuhopecten yessoensis]OWF38804.1 hypothetical protein KP79_PYT16687 [Mizuhopecten yessoensis]
MDDDSSIESLNPDSLERDDSLGSVKFPPNSPNIDMTWPYPHPPPGEVDYLDSKEDSTNSFDFLPVHQMENELLLTKDELGRYQTRLTDALMIISVLLWNASSHNPSKPPPRYDNIAYFKQCVEKFMTRILDDTSNGEGLAEAYDSAWKQTEHNFNIFTNQLKKYMPSPTPTNGRRDIDVTDEYVEFPTQDHEGEACPSTVPKEVDESTGQDMWTVPRETKDTDLQRSVADHESNAKQDQKRIMFGVPSAATKTNKGAFNTAIHMPGKNVRDFLAKINNEQLSGDQVGDDVTFAKQHLQSTVIYRPDAPNDVRQPNQKETKDAITQTEAGTVILSNEGQSPTTEALNERGSSSDKTTAIELSDQNIEKEVIVPRTAHEENEEINVKLDSMSTQLEELKMMLSNVTQMPYPPPAVSNRNTDILNNALYMPGMTGTNF